MEEVKRSFGEQIFIEAIKRLPVYDFDNRKWKSVGGWMEEIIRDSSGDPQHGSRIERDPIGTAWDLLFKGVPTDRETFKEWFGIDIRP